MKADSTIRLIAFLEGELNPTEREVLKEELKQDAELQMELEKLEELYTTMEADAAGVDPPAELRSDFEALLAAEKRNIANKELWIKWFARSAAAVTLIAVGVWVGVSVRTDDNSQERQIAELQQEIKANRKLILQSLQQPSATQRFIGVSASNSIESPDPQVIDALIKVMNTDDNTNVRLAAVRALSRFSDDSTIRKSLIDALVSQPDPLVQVALIDILVGLGEKQVVPALEQLIRSDTTMEAVRDEAQWGVMKLS